MQNIIYSMNASVGSVYPFISSSRINNPAPLQHYSSGLFESYNMNSPIPGRFPTKEWHKSCTFNIRNRLIRKLAQFISATPDQPAGSAEERMHNSISIATGIENETYRAANSMSQYYELMAKKGCFFTKRANPAQSSLQYCNAQDMQRAYDALGIVFPGNSLPTPSGMRLQNPETPPILHGIMGSDTMPYCPFTRAQGGLHSVHIPPLGTLPMDLDAEVPEVIRQLAHAYKCQERDNQENDIMMICTLPHCRETKILLNHIQTCQIGINCCGSTKEIIDHWNRCCINDCPICVPVRQAERNINSTLASHSQLNGHMNLNPMYMRRSHRGIHTNYPSTATSGLLSNQNNNRSDRISSRNPMWHSPYTLHGWRSQDNNMENSRRPQSRYLSHGRGNLNRHDRRPPYGNPWAPDIIFVENMRSNQSRGSMFTPSMSRNDRLPSHGASWRSQEVLFVEHGQSHRSQETEDQMNVQNDDEVATSENQQIVAMIKTVKAHGNRLEQKYRCSRRSCNAAWPCLHRRLAASIRHHETPIPA